MNTLASMTHEDYPKNFQEFISRFQKEEDCWKYLFDIRWLDGFECPKCKCKEYWLNKRNDAECNECGHSNISYHILYGVYQFACLVQV